MQSSLTFRSEWEEKRHGQTLIGSVTDSKVVTKIPEWVKETISTVRKAWVACSEWEEMGM